jgi:3-isopropylmalate/(R)-2-methylmalate dehydratase small subunit
VRELHSRAASLPGYTLDISLEDQTVHDDHGLSASFEMDPFRRDCLLQGLDDIGLSLRNSTDLDKFEKQHDKSFWLSPRPAESTNQRIGELA